jgi:hypothetical protein
MKPSVLPDWIRKPLGPMWRSRGGGYYGMGYVVSYFVLEIRMLVGDVQETEGVADFMTQQGPGRCHKGSGLPQAVHPRSTLIRSHIGTYHS